MPGKTAAPKTANAGLAVGLKRGYQTKKRTQRVKPSYNKGKQGKRTQLVKSIVREVAGYAPYERRLLELLRNGLDKRALKYAKKKVGTHRRGKAKREEMSAVLRNLRSKK
eukprot:TRINITY_DN1574_c0_g1_i1.p1 TRINITY_DN1574_c0_g1~~TRINITY_DN1574_c0_g1_i1.p1  ORF type:complete len:110 (-),score=42.49 TRINITY_DN1574_c0_g1_i1:139-468(-)